MSDRGESKLLKVSVLGTVDIRVDDAPVELKAPMMRALLVLLCMRQGRAVAAERLIDELWEEDPPSGAKSTLQSYISNIRRLLGSECIETVGSGYKLGGRVDLDLTQFEAELSSVHAQTVPSSSALDPEGILEIVEQACELWRGGFAEDVRPHDRIDRYAKVVGEKRLHATLIWLSLLAETSPERSISELRLLRSSHPTDERFVLLLMRSLAHLGRSVDALREYQLFRGDLIEKTGLSPSAEVQELEHQITTGIVSSGCDITTAGISGVGSFGIEALGTGSEVVMRSRPKVPSNSFIGRQGQVVKVAAILQRQRLVSLVGCPGVGKTRLAAEVSEMVGSAFESVYRIDVALGDASAIRQQLRSLVAERSSATSTLEPEGLLIVDSCEADVSIVAELRHLLGARPRLKVLTTSQVPLKLNQERVVRVQPLSLAAPVEPGLSSSAQLLVERMASIGGLIDEADWVGIEQVARATNGLPLVIEWAAQQTVKLGFDQMLIDPERHLGDYANRSGERRYGRGSVKELLGRSTKILSPPEYRLLTALTVYDSEFSRPAVYKLGGMLGIDVHESLQRLVDASVLLVEDSPNGARYRLLSLMRDLLRQGWDDTAGRSVVERGFVTHYAAFASGLAVEVRQMSVSRWGAELRSERANMLAALLLARRQEMVVEAVQLLWVFLWQSSELEELVDIGSWIHESLQDGVLDGVGEEVTCKAHVESVVFGFRFGVFVDVSSAAQRAVESARQVDGESMLVEALSMQGAVATAAGELPLAFSSLAEAESLCRSVGHLWGLAIVDLFRSVAERLVGRLELSYEIGRRALGRLVYLKDRRGMSLATFSIAMTLRDIGHAGGQPEANVKSYVESTLSVLALSYGSDAVAEADLDFGRPLFVEAFQKGVAIGDRSLISSSLEWVAFVDSIIDGRHDSLAFVEGYTSQFRSGITRPTHEIALKDAERALGPEMFDIELRNGRCAELDQVAQRLGVEYDAASNALDN